MHPRNIYKIPPNFKELALKYPNFSPYVKIDLSGNGKLDFQNPNALAELTKTLLLKDFDLLVDIPVDKLIPTLPLRLNYILWIEDLLTVSGILNTQDINGIDIGTGASCIYPLLAAKKGWKMLATEIDPTSVLSAKNNVESNGFSEMIDVRKVSGTDSVFKNVLDKNKVYQFSMCNPPFFAHSEVREDRKKNRKPPNNARSGASNEVETDGGEVEFVMKMINESLELKDSVSVYSTMLGKLSSLKILRGKLKQLGINNSSTTEFRQGKTTRWGLAWSFLHKLPETPTKKAKNKPLVFDLPDGTTYDYCIQLVQKLLTDLDLIIVCVKSQPKDFQSVIKACEITWMDQRRKRREKIRQGEIPSPAKKRKTDVILEFSLNIYEHSGVVSIETKWLSGSLGKDSVHQILQYLKNNWKIQN